MADPVMQKIRRAQDLSSRSTLWFFAMFIPAMAATNPDWTWWALGVATFFFGMAAMDLVMAHRLLKEVEKDG